MLFNYQIATYIHTWNYETVARRLLYIIWFYDQTLLHDITLTHISNSITIVKPKENDSGSCNMTNTAIHWHLRATFPMMG